MRPRLSPMINALATSKCQIAGAIASEPPVRRSRTPSVYVSRSSEKHHAKATEASRTNLLEPAAFIDQLSNRKIAQGDFLTYFPHFVSNLLEVFLLALLIRNQASNWNAATCDAYRFTLGNLLE